jgi:hypothetical protein
MTESTGQHPQGGVNAQPDDGSLPGEDGEPGMVDADPAGEPRAARGPMSEDVTQVPGNSADPDAKAPGISDATGPQG